MSAFDVVCLVALFVIALYGLICWAVQKQFKLDHRENP